MNKCDFKYAKTGIKFPLLQAAATYEFTPVMHHGIDSVTVVWVYSIIYCCESVFNSLAPLKETNDT